MPIELHERLSEFSYGYGVTREFEYRLTTLGLKCTPFLPSLLHEAKLGFDVAFARTGTPLLLQFKLGQSLRRFVPSPRPTLQLPFWRFHVDTSEPDGQFEMLLKAEQDGADVLYLAPMFHDWAAYLDFFERRAVVQASLMVTPIQIRRALVTNAVADGVHKIVYDKYNSYLCSTPIELPSISYSELETKLLARVEREEAPIGKVLEQVLEGFSNRSTVRRPQAGEEMVDDDRSADTILRQQRRSSQMRRERLRRIQNSGRSREEAVALAVGAEAWSFGAQLMFVTKPDS